MQEKKFSEAERLTQEAARAAREAHLRAEEAAEKQRLAQEAERRAQELRAKHDQEAHQLEALRAKVREGIRNESPSKSCLPSMLSCLRGPQIPRCYVVLST